MAKREKTSNFEERMAQLEQLVAQLEAGQLPLDESFAAYERGIALVDGLGAELTKHEAKVALLTEKGEQPLTTEEGE